MEEGKICRSNPESSDQEKAVHMLLVSYPLQGHITPFIKLAYLIAGRGIMATLVITEFAHARMIASEPDFGNESNNVRYITVPDGLSEDERNDDVKLSQSISKVMPGHLREVIEKMNMEGNQVTCVVADPMFGWAFEIAETMNLKLAIFWTSAPGVLALILSIPKLIEDGIIDTKGSSKIDGKIQLSPDLPPLTSADFLWNYSGNQTPAEIMFQYFFSIHLNLKRSGWLLCNFFHELNPLVGNLVPNMFPVGPLLASGKPAANLWPEDLTCLSWLNKQPAGSVIYVAFGSITVLSQHQMDELALGLELVGRPFIWVKRSDLIKGGSSKNPDGYEERVANRGKIVQWAPQEQVLAHPSIACFLTHCGWNSTMDGLSMGVPFLCWPYFADQYYNRSCICNGYKVGLTLSPDEYGIVTRHEIRRKLDSLVADDGIKANALKLKEMAHRSISDGGFSARYLDNFIQQMKQ